MGARRAIATEHYLSAQAGMKMLLNGGNAFDAKAAAVFVDLGFDPLRFAILFAVNLQTSFMTPPFGFSLFYNSVQKIS